MVCQGASQTRFRALKHENGIAGKTTIIVRIIACFQPMPDCQAEYFRHLLKPVTVNRYRRSLPYMFEPSSSRVCQQHTLRESSDFKNRMIAPFEQRQHEFLPASINPFKELTSLGLNGMEFHNLSKKGLTQEANGFIGKTDIHPPSNELPSYPLEKRFLIFDHSGDETRLMFSSLPHRVKNLTKYPAWNPHDAPASFFGANRLTALNRQSNKDEQVWINAPFIHEDFDENEVVEEGSDMREDTEEINALLYSDYDYDDDDEEASTGHSPFVKDSDDFDISSKRRKILDGERNENLLLENIHGEDIICGLDEEFEPGNGRKRPRTEKIHDTLKVLEGIIPGVRSKNPLAILDEAISYLKHLKRTAKVMSTITKDPNSHEPST